MNSKTIYLLVQKKQVIVYHENSRIISFKGVYKSINYLKYLKKMIITELKITDFENYNISYSTEFKGIKEERTVKIFKPSKKIDSTEIKTIISEKLKNYGDTYFRLNDYSKAMNYYQKSAELNNIEAIVNIGKFYNNGFGCEKNYKTACEWFEKINDYSVLFSLGLDYFYGIKVNRDYVKALQWFEKCINCNNKTIKMTGYCYDQLGDRRKSELYFNQITNKYDLNEVAEYYAKKLSPDFEKTIHYYEKAVQLGSIEALVNLGKFYDNGLGFEKSYKKACEYFNQIKEDSYLIKLGIDYLEGYKVNFSFEKAIEWLKKVNKKTSAVYKYLGFAYDKLGNYEKSEYYFKNVQTDCHLNEIGEYYLKKIRPDYKRAYKYFFKSANSGNSHAMCNIAEMFEQALGFPQNYKIAFDWYKNAVNSENSYAMKSIGDYYSLGLYFGKDSKSAKQYYLSAEKLGYVFDIKRFNKRYYLSKFEKAKENLWNDSEVCQISGQ